MHTDCRASYIRQNVCVVWFQNVYGVSFECAVFQTRHNVYLYMKKFSNGLCQPNQTCAGGALKRIVELMGGMHYTSVDTIHMLGFETVGSEPND